MSRILRYCKFAEEATVGEDPAPSPQITTDIASATLDAPSDTQQVWGGGIGRSARTHRPGYYSTSGNIVLPVDVHTVARFLKWALGGYVFTADTPEVGTNLHEFYGSTDTELPSFAALLGKDLFEHRFAGCMVSQLALAVSDGYAQITLDVLGGKDANATLDQEVLGDLPLPPPLTFPNFRVYVGGTDSGDEVSAEVTSLTLTVNNNGAADAARGLGSRFPRRKIPAGERSTTLEMTVYYGGTEHIERLWGSAAGPSDDGSTEYEIRLTADSGDDGSLQIDLPRCISTQVQTQPSGRGRIEQSLNIMALLGTVDLEDASTVESELYARLTNDQSEVTAA